MNTTAGSTEKIVGAQMAALVRRLSEGTPLTAAQLEFVRENMARRDASRSPEDDGEDVIASNASELAALLGVSRQLVRYHQGRAGSPTTLSVAEWREYLSVHAKADVRARLGTGKRRGLVLPNPGIFAIGVFNHFCESLEVIVSSSAEHAGVRMTKPQVERMTLGVFNLLSHLLDTYLLSHGQERYWLEFDPPDDDGQRFTTEIPAAIAELKQRADARAKAERKAKRDRRAEQQPPTH